MAWTDERVDQLKRDWADGLTASLIATRLGGVTRNAVISKIHRIGAAGTSPNSRKKPQYKRRRTQKQKQFFFGKPKAQAPVLPVEPLPSFEELVIPLNERKSVQTLEDNSCRWPIGDPQLDDFHFCGKNKVLGLSYCEFHQQRAYQPRRIIPRLSGRVVGLAKVDNLKFDAVREFQDA